MKINVFVWEMEEIFIKYDHVGIILKEIQRVDLC